MLIDRQNYPQAQAVVEALLKLEPGNRYYLSLSAAAYVVLGRHERAIEVYRQLLAASLESAELRVTLGHSLQSLGRQNEAIECYQAAAAVRPGFGDAWWSLANLKTYRFSQQEIARMRAEEAAPSADPGDRYHLCFALGKAYEDRNEFAESWQFYERGNRLKRTESRYQPETTEINTRRQIEVSTSQFCGGARGDGRAEPRSVRMHSHPYPRKMFQLPGVLVILYEMGVNYRQIFTDGRPLHADPNPSFNGYSSGKWEGDTLVVETIGFRDDLWLDHAGNPLTRPPKLRAVPAPGLWAFGN